MTKENIKFMIEPNFLSKEEIENLTHRFNISAYSYEFWKSDIVENFIDVSSINFPIKNDSNIFENSYYFRDYSFSGGIDNSGKIYMMRPIVTSYYSGTSSYGRYPITSYGKHLKFILGTLELLPDNTIYISNINDIGKPAITYDYRGTSLKSFTDIYPNTKIPNQPSTDIPENIRNIVLGYKTKDGYFSNSLHFMLKYDCIYGVSKLGYFPLPIKL